MNIKNTIKYFLLGVAILMVIFLFTGIKRADAGQGCCSWHGGQNYCDYDVGRWVCNDNTYSPSCGCPVIKNATCTIKASPSTITWGDSASLSWSSPNASYVTSSSFNTFDLSGNKSVSPLFDTTYNLSVKNLRGTAECQISIKVNPKIETKNETEVQSILLEDKIVKNTNQSSWHRAVVDDGLVGSKDIIYTVTYTNTIETKREKASETIKVEPKEKVIEVGTMSPINYLLILIKNWFTNIL